MIVAQEVTAHSADSRRLRPMLERLEENLARVGGLEEERRPKWSTADAGYCSEANLGMLAERQIDAYVATGRERHHRGGIAHGNRTRTPLRAAMRDKLQTTEGRAIYARRKAITEPVHGLIKQARGFRQFLLRGLDKVAGEVHPDSPDPQSPETLASRTGANGVSQTGTRTKGPKTV